MRKTLNPLNLLSAAQAWIYRMRAFPTSSLIVHATKIPIRIYFSFESFFALAVYKTHCYLHYWYNYFKSLFNWKSFFTVENGQRSGVQGALWRLITKIFSHIARPWNRWCLIGKFFYGNEQFPFFDFVFDLKYQNEFIKNYRRTILMRSQLAWGMI